MATVIDLSRQTLVSVGELARRFSISRGTAYGLVRDRKVPSVRINRALRVPLEAAAQAIAAGSADPSNAAEQSTR